MPYGAMTGYGGGPSGATDNGDGTYTFQFADGRPPLTAAGPIAQQKFSEVQSQPSPAADLVDTNAPDQRTAQVGYGMGGAGGVGAPPKSLSDAAASGAAGNEEVAPPPRQGTTIPNNEGPTPTGPGVSTGGAQERLLPGQAPQQVDPSKLSFSSGQGGTGGGPPMVYVPGSKGGWVASSKVERPGYQASEGVQTARQAAQGLETDAAQSQYEAQQQKTNYEVTAAAQRADAVGQQLAEDSARMTQQQNQVTAKLAELDRLGDDVGKMKVDPGQFFKEQGAVGTIGMALAAAAGGFAQGLTGAPNAALATINQMVDRNIQGQRENIANAKDKLAAKRQGVKDLQQSFQSANEQEAARRALAWKAVDAQLDAQKAKLGPAFDDAAYNQMKAGIAEKRAASMAAFEKEARTETQVSSRYAPPVAGGFRQAAPSKFEHDRYVAAFGGLAPDAPAATKAREAAATYQDMDSLAQENIELRKDPKAFIPGTDANARLKSNQAQLVLRVKDAEKLGVIAGPDMGLTVDALGDGTSIKPGQTAALQNYMAGANRRNAHMRQNLGITPVQVAPYMNPRTGQVEMGQYYTGGPSAPVAAPSMTERGQ